MQIAVIGIDLGRNICSLAGIDGSGQVVVRRRVRRENVFKIVSQLKPGTVAMEARGGARLRLMSRPRRRGSLGPRAPASCRPTKH
jgi:hypothetical protein